MFLLFILFIWLIVLQAKHNKLNKKLEDLKKQYDEELSFYYSRIMALENKNKTETVNGSYEKDNEQRECQNQTESVSNENLTNNVNTDSFNDKSTETNIEPETIHQEQKESQNNEDKKTDSPINQAKKENISFVHIFSWIGGFILLLGVIFWIKYALENELISASLRVAIGTIAGIVMWGTGLLLRKPNVKTTSDTLCACGLCTCYSVCFASYYFYHMATAGVTFAFLGLIAIVSFATAVWKNAQYIGILAQIIGFFTPFLFRSETPQIWFLLGYTGVINVAAVSAALKRNWTQQLFTGLAFTFLCFLAVVEAGNILQLTVFATIFALFYSAISIKEKNPGLLRYSFLFTSIGLLVLGFRGISFRLETLPHIIIFASLFVVFFGVLAAWQKNLKLSIATFAFTFLAFVFVALSESFISLFFFVSIASLFFCSLFFYQQNRYFQIGSMILSVLGFVTFFSCQPKTVLSISYLPYLAGFVLFFNVFFGLIAFRKRDETLLISTIFLTLIDLAFLMTFKNVTYLLVLASIFTIFFGIISSRLSKLYALLASILFSTISIIFICGIGKLNLHYLLAFAFVSMIFYMYYSIKKKSGIFFASSASMVVFPLLILICYTLFNSRSHELLSWFALWSILITIIPYFFKNTFEDSKSVWISLSLCNLLSALFMRFICYCSKDEVSLIYGIVALSVALVYALFAKRIYLWNNNIDDKPQYLRLSCFSFAPIIFLTLAVSLHSSNEWKTMAFACEGLFLIWLWNRFKVNIVQNFGAVLLGFTAIRLLMNPCIVDYYEKVNLVLNWYLYTYLFCAICMFASSYFWRKTSSKTLPTMFNIIGGIFLFALVNIEIANYFCEGRELSFNFCGKVSEAAAYTIAWALCGGLCMFLANIKLHKLLKVGIGLISLSVLKLFISDIWLLTSGLRIVVLIGVAVIMLAVSFIYQQFRKIKTN